MGAGNAALRKVGVLVAKDAVDLFKNPGMLVSLVLPVGFSALQGFLLPEETLAAVAEGSADAAPLVSMLLVGAVSMAIAMVGSMAMLYSLAEEKEKRTLRTLVLSNVSAGQVLCAKALVGLAGIVGVALASFFVLRRLVPGLPLNLLAPYLLFGVVGAATMVAPSLVLGLACRDQMTASFYAVPVVLAGLAPIFGSLGSTAAEVVRFFPTGGACELLNLAVEGALTPDAAVVPLLVTVAWVVAGAVAFKLLYRRLAQDN